MTEQKIESVLELALERGEVGVQVAAYLGEELIVDECIGIADEDSGQAVTTETLFPVFSVSKAFLATCVHLQVERGLVDLDEPIASYWPEYAQNGKADITSRDVLMHRSGVPHMPADHSPEDLSDWESLLEFLAAVEPLGRPGERSIHHAVSFGYILAEVIRRTDPQHRMYGDFLRDEICAVLDIKDLWVGLPPEQESRVARLTWGAYPPATGQPGPLRVLTQPLGMLPGPEIWNRPEVRRACIPGGGAITTARDGAKFFSLLANGGALGGTRLLSSDRLFGFTEPRPRPSEPEEDTGIPVWHGVGGYRIGGESPPAEPCLGPGRHVLGHGGAGGSVGFADLDSKLAVMVTHNRMFAPAKREEHPFVPLCDAIRELV